MRPSQLVVLLLLGSIARGEVTHVAIKSGLILQPNQTYTITVDALEPTEIAWRNVQAKACSTNCVQSTDLTGSMHMTFAAALGGSKKYTPASGRISIEYKNISGEPVTIDIFRIRRTCNAEACKFVDKNAKARWLVYKISSFKAITTSKDESYSLISGTAMSGRSFTVRAVWWTDDSKGYRISCSKWIKGYLDKSAPADSYSPYILSGQATGDGNNIVLIADTCVPKAPHFGVPEANVFK